MPRSTPHRDVLSCTSFRRQQLSGFAIFFVFSTCHCTSNTHKLQCVAAVPCRMVSSMLTNRLRPPRPRKSFNWARPLAAQPASEIMLTTSADMSLKLLPPPPLRKQLELTLSRQNNCRTGRLKAIYFLAVAVLSIPLLFGNTNGNTK